MTGGCVVRFLAAISVICAAAVPRDGSNAKAQGGTEAPVVINEVVTDPQQDWNDSSGGNGVAFDDQPGDGTVGSTDEWIELLNTSDTAIDLTAGSGWTLEMIDSTPDTLSFSDPGSTVLVFSDGGSVTNFQPGEYLVVGNPPGAINNDVFIVLKDGDGAVVDDVELGDDLEEDGTGDGAPDGSSGGGNATGIEDEAIARVPDGVDTDNDVDDFVQQAATIGAPNDGGEDEVEVPDIAVDPTAHDYGDVEVGSSASQTFVVSNDGTADLDVSATTLTGDDADQFSIDSGGGPFTLAPGQSQDVVVSFSPTTEGQKSATLRIESNDPDENPLDVALTGTGVAPVIGIRVDLPDDAEGESGTSATIPVLVSDLTGEEVFGYATIIAFDQSVLDATGASSSGTLSESFGEPLDITVVDGFLGVVGYGKSPLEGQGTLVNLEFDVVGEPGQVTDLVFVDFIFNLGEPPAVTDDGKFTVTAGEDADPATVAAASAGRSDGFWSWVSPDGAVRQGGQLSLLRRWIDDHRMRRLPQAGDGLRYDFQGAWAGATGEPSELPREHRLLQNSPNPFNPETSIRFALPQPTQVRLVVYDLKGRRVRVLVDKKLPAGIHAVRWDGTDTFGRNLASGVYFYRLEAGKFVQTRRMLLVK